jgi:membrane-bound hydrogenase subunit beta
MGVEENIQSEIIKKFAFLDGKVTVQRPRRLFVDVSQEKFANLFEYAIKNLEFTILCAITGLDEGTGFGIIYHLARESGIMLNIKTTIDRGNPVLKTITGSFLCADIYERELVDLLGIKVEGLPPGNRYPLPDDWPAGEYPLRKDWKKKEGVKPNA